MLDWFILTIVCNNDVPLLLFPIAMVLFYIFILMKWLLGQTHVRQQWNRGEGDGYWRVALFISKELAANKNPRKLFY